MAVHLRQRHQHLVLLDQPCHRLQAHAHGGRPLYHVRQRGDGRAGEDDRAGVVPAQGAAQGRGGPGHVREAQRADDAVLRAHRVLERLLTLAAAARPVSDLLRVEEAVLPGESAELHARDPRGSAALV